MCVKLSSENLNFGSYPPHFTNTYTCEVTIVPKMYGNLVSFLKKYYRIVPLISIIIFKNQIFSNQTDLIKMYITNALL